MAKTISTTQVRGTVSRIYIREGETHLSSMLLMLENDPRVYDLGLTGTDEAAETSIKLTKPGDAVSFTLRKERALILGEYELMLLWNNWTLGIEQVQNGVKPENTVQG